MPLTAPLVTPLATEVTIDSTTWAALALVLTIIGAALSWVAWRRNGLAAGIRGLAWTLVPVAAWLTGTLRLAADVVEAVIDWSARLVFSPTVWAGIIVAGLAAVLWVVSGSMRARGIGVRGKAAERATRKAERVQAKGRTPVEARGPAPSGKSSKPGKPGKPAQGRHADDLDDMDDIEAILKKHGI